MRNPPILSAPAQILAVVLLACLALAGGCAKRQNQRPASSLSDSDRAALDKYEAARKALAEDDLRAAKRAALGLVKIVQPVTPSSLPVRAMLEPAEIVADSTSLDKARDNFKALSAAAIQLAGNVDGFYVIHCPMTADGNWLQTNEIVDNPYMGKVMHDCGVVQK